MVLLLLLLRPDAFQSSLRESLEMKAGVMPLSLKIELLMCSLYVRLWTLISSVLTVFLDTRTLRRPFWPFASVVTIFEYLSILLRAVQPYSYDYIVVGWSLFSSLLCTGT